MDGFITKPIGIEQLKATLDCLAERRCRMNQAPLQAYDRDKLVELFGDDPRTLAEVEREFLDTARVAERENHGHRRLEGDRPRRPPPEGRVGHDRAATLRQIAEALERAAKGDDLTGVRRLYGLFAQEVRRVAEQAGVAAD